MNTLTKEIKFIDTDTHAIEPYDLWTSRVSVKKWGDKVPHVKFDTAAGEDAWFFGDERMGGAAGAAWAGWKDPPPSHPRSMEDAKPATYDAGERLKLMDDYGIYAQILYPNVAGFGAGRYLALGDRELMLACVRAYNDWLSEWASADKRRLIPQMAMPFWDFDESIKEMERAAKLGHKGIVMCGEPEYFDLPALTDPHWNNFWAAAQDMQLPINFHVGTGDFASMRVIHPSRGKGAAFAAAGVNFYMHNVSVMSQVLCGGIAHDFPKLNFVSVESGIGWMPYALESMDWQFTNGSAGIDHPDWELPSEYFKRQFYGCFWHEEATVAPTVEILGADNFLYETDFPHPTSMSPGPATTADVPSDYIQRTVGQLPRDAQEKILHSNAARIYHLD